MNFITLKESWQRVACMSLPVERLKVLWPVFFLLAAAAVFLAPQSAQGFWPFTDLPQYQPLVTESKSASGFWPLSNQPEKQEPGVEPRAVPGGPVEGLEEKISELATGLTVNLAAADSARSLLDGGLIVCTFVELGNLSRSSSFGRYLADRLMNSFQQAEYRVVETRKTRELLIQEGRGEHGLSRDPARLFGEVAAGASLTGTYTETPEYVLVNARIVDNRDATVLSSATTIFPRSGLVETLLADRSSIKAKDRRQVVYMKRLSR